MKLFLLGISGFYMTLAIDLEKMFAALSSRLERQREILEEQNQLIQNQQNLTQEENDQAWEEHEALWQADEGEWQQFRDSY